MKNLAYRILGDSPENLKNHTPASRKKIIALATAILIPTLLWLLTGYLAATSMLKLSPLWGLIIGAFCSLFVFSIDRSIAITNGGWGMITVRVFFGVTVAIIGSILIDSAFFSSDIDYYMSQKLVHSSDQVVAEVKNRRAQELSQQRNIVEERYKEFTELQSNYNNELDGTGGTKLYGKGAVAAEKSSLMSNAFQEYRAQLGKLHEMEGLIATESKAAQAEVLRNTGKNTIVTRIIALDEYVDAFPAAKRFCYTLTFLLFLLEMSVVLLKLFSKKTSYELEQERADTIRNIKSQQILNTVSEPADIDKRLGHYGRAAMRAIK